MAAVVLITRSLTVGDQAGNDAIYAAWVRSQLAELERLIEEQGRQPSPGGPARRPGYRPLECHAALKDADGALLVQAFALAPEPFRVHLAQTVAASPDPTIDDQGCLPPRPGERHRGPG